MVLASFTMIFRIIKNTLRCKRQTQSPVAFLKRSVFLHFGLKLQMDSFNHGEGSTEGLRIREHNRVKKKCTEIFGWVPI